MYWNCLRFRDVLRIIKKTRQELFKWFRIACLQIKLRILLVMELHYNTFFYSTIYVDDVCN